MTLQDHTKAWNRLRHPRRRSVWRILIDAVRRPNKLHYHLHELRVRCIELAIERDDAIARLESCQRRLAEAEQVKATLLDTMVSKPKARA